MAESDRHDASPGQCLLDDVVRLLHEYIAPHLDCDGLNSLLRTSKSLRELAGTMLVDGLSIELHPEGADHARGTVCIVAMMRVFVLRSSASFLLQSLHPCCHASCALCACV